MFPNRYILDERGEPVFEPDLITWARWLNDGDRRRVDLTELGTRGQVSTVFLGLDHNFDADSAPVLWESMIFGGPLDQYQTRYDSLESARVGHATLVAACRALPWRAVFGYQVGRWIARALLQIKRGARWLKNLPVRAAGVRC